MATIVKQPSIMIKCSNPPENIESIECMALESAMKEYPILMIWIYSNTKNLTKDNFMPSEYLQRTLSDTLNYFPILTGRPTVAVNGTVTMHLTNEGVLYTEAECLNQTLDYFIPETLLDKDFDYEHINTSDLFVKVKNDCTGVPLSIQVTRLKCNSVILNISASHCVFDAKSVAFFINTWASAKPPQQKPFFDRNFILYPSEEQRKQTNCITRPNHCAYNRNVKLSSDSPSIQIQQQPVISKVYFFSSNELKNLKKAASKDLPDSIDYISTYDALFAHMILVLAQAIQTSLIDNIKILQAFNGRPNFVPSCSSDILNYFGSFAFWLYTAIPTDEQAILSSLAQLIHQMYSKQTENSLRDYNGYLISDDDCPHKNQVDADIFNHDFHCVSWRKVNMLSPNFNGNAFPIYSGPTRQLYPRYCIMLDTYKGDESINIVLGLREQDYQRMIHQNILHKYR